MSSENEISRRPRGPHGTGEWPGPQTPEKVEPISETTYIGLAITSVLVFAVGLWMLKEWPFPYVKMACRFAFFALMMSTLFSFMGILMTLLSGNWLGHFGSGFPAMPLPALQEMPVNRPLLANSAQSNRKFPKLRHTCSG